jgi:multicomponent Na+:H+ antiporter subunit G
VNPVAGGPVADVISAALMLLGALSCLIGAIGLVRLPDLAARLQAATKPQTLGLALVLLGTALRVELASAVTLVLVVLFQVITAPVISQLVGRAAYRSGAIPEGGLVVDELADRLPPGEEEGSEEGGREEEDRGDGTPADRDGHAARAGERTARDGGP